MIKNIISDIGNVLFEFDTSGFIDKNIETDIISKILFRVFELDKVANFSLWRIFNS